MIINHNISAMNSNRMFANNVKRMEKRMANLSSGFRVNSGADDAAGLAVSEKMRAQVRGLNQASRNIQDGISLVQTVEGHLAESNDVLHRMRELSVQAANGTYNQEDRAQITVELDEMVKELNRIHEDAKFNQMRVLDGKSLALNNWANIDAGTGLPNAAEQATRNPNFNESRADAATALLNSAQGTPANGLVVQSGANTDERMFLKIDGFSTASLGLTGVPDANYSATGNGGAEELAWRERSFYQAAPFDLNAAMYLESPITEVPAGPGSVNIDNMFPDLTQNRVSVSTNERATETITVLDVALNKVNKQRANVGAFQNRLEKAQQGVENASENLQAAESRIRDADMAKEFVNFTKDQILSQSAASMTAQANMRSQLVMRILG